MDFWGTFKDMLLALSMNFPVGLTIFNELIDTPDWINQT